MATKQHVEVAGKRLALTNLDKVLYPGNGFSKAHVIDYYVKVSQWLLPHFFQRPVTLNRFPDGVRGKAFYEKDAPEYLPDWAHTTNVPRQAGGEPIRYICIDDLATLVWCANMASLELHPFLHRAENLDRPDAIVFDLDPGDGMDLVGCAGVAFLVRKLLETNGLECFPKVSGSKGLQIYVPLNTRVSYADARAAAQSVAQILARKHPTLVVSEMAKPLRKGKIFIDWSQNSDYKTTIGVYSLRAKNDVPFVSAPVSWAEVAAVLKKKDPELVRFEPEALLQRLEKTGDLFSPLLTLEQDLSPIREERVSVVPKKTVPAKEDAPAKRARTRASAKSSFEFIEPMLLLKTDKLPEGEQWLYELKLDGYRALAYRSGSGVELRSRNDNDFVGRFPSIAGGLAALPNDTLIDGEVVALDEDGKPSFSLLQNYGSTKGPLVYYVFDLLMLKGKSLVGEPLTKRRELLEEEIIPKLTEPIRLSPVLQASLKDLIHSVKAQGLEGIIAKRKDSPYQPGERSGLWQKMRVNQGQELVIAGYTPGAKNFDALILGYYEGSKLMYAARTRNGFTLALREKVFAKLKNLEIKTCPFANLPEKSAGRWGQGLTAKKMEECRWLKPVTVGQFEFVEWTPENHLRHSTFVALREDKKASDVVKEG